MGLPAFCTPVSLPDGMPDASPSALPLLGPAARWPCWIIEVPRSRSVPPPPPPPQPPPTSSLIPITNPAVVFPHSSLSQLAVPGAGGPADPHCPTATASGTNGRAPGAASRRPHRCATLTSIRAASTVRPQAGHTPTSQPLPPDFLIGMLSFCWQRPKLNREGWPDFGRIRILVDCSVRGQPYQIIIY